MRSTIKNLYWIDISILLLALVVTLFGLGSYGLYEPHEGHFAMVGQEMIWRNDWITPHLNGSPYLNKPPLLYWLIAASTGIFGSSEFAARLPIGLAGWVGIVVAWKWTRELWGISASRIAALMLSVTLGWFIFTHQILIDALLGTLLISTNYFLWRSLYQPQSRINWWGTYISLALCILTKGLIGVVFPVLGCLGLIIARRDLKIIRRIKLKQGLCLILAIILPWFIAIEQANPGFWHYFIVNEHFDRLLDRRYPPDYEVSKISAWGYLAITGCWCFPWILFLPSVVKSTVQEWQRGFMKNASVLDRKNSDGIFLLSLAAILPVALFLPLASRLIYYSIPAIPAYIILCAGWWSKQRRRTAKINPQSQTSPTKIVDYSASNPVYPNAIGTLCQSSVQVISEVIPKQSVDYYGAIALVIGVSCYSSILFLPAIVAILPAGLQTTEISLLIVIVAIILGTGWITSGVGMIKRSSLAWLPLVAVLIITYLATIRGFYLYQDVRSSKNLVLQANSCLSSDTLWTYEGSREIGAAGAISYYLNQAEVLEVQSSLAELASLATNIPRPYRQVLVLADGGANRIPPRFPGSPPDYLISQLELQNYWDSDRPLVFLTDFLRQPQDKNDPLTLNLPQGAGKPYLVSGQRQLYLNQAARQLAQTQCPN